MSRKHDERSKVERHKRLKETIVIGKKLENLNLIPRQSQQDLRERGSE